LSVVCCQVEVSATSWSLDQRSPTKYGASFCVITKLRERGDHSPLWAAVNYSPNEFVTDSVNKIQTSEFPGNRLSWTYGN
jgi:hypothetical protein